MKTENTNDAVKFIEEHTNDGYVLEDPKKYGATKIKGVDYAITHAYVFKDESMLIWDAKKQVVFHT